MSSKSHFACTFLQFVLQVVVIKLAPVCVFLNVFYLLPHFVLCCGIVLVMSLCFRHAVKKSKDWRECNRTGR